jgi:hypothetical protein
VVAFFGALLLAPGCRDKAQSTALPQILAEFPIAQEGGRIFLPLKLKGKEYTFLLDTGCSVILFDTSLREHLGEQKGTAEAVSYAGKVLTCQVFDAPEAFVGPLNILDCGDVHCLDLEVYRSDFNVAVDGIVGMNFLNNYVVQIDFDHSKVIFLKPIESAGSDWGTGLDMGFQKEAPYVVGKVLPGIEASFMLDTGCPSYNAVSTEVFERIQRSEPDACFEGTIDSTGVTTKCRVAVVSNVTFGPLDYQNMYFLEHYFSILGMPFLSRHLVTFDFPNSRLYLKKGTRFLLPDGTTQLTVVRLGLVLRRNEESVFVDSVDPNGPAYKQGIRQNDIILRVRDQGVTSFDLVKVADLLLESGKENSTITVRRGHSIIEAPLVFSDEADTANGTD